MARYLYSDIVLIINICFLVWESRDWITYPIFRSFCHRFSVFLMELKWFDAKSHTHIINSTTINIFSFYLSHPNTKNSWELILVRFLKDSKEALYTGKARAFFWQKTVFEIWWLQKIAYLLVSLLSLTQKGELTTFCFTPCGNLLKVFFAFRLIKFSHSNSISVLFIDYFVG